MEYHSATRKNQIIKNSVIGTRKHIEWGNPDTERKNVVCSLLLEESSSKSSKVNTYPELTTEIRKVKTD